MVLIYEQILSYSSTECFLSAYRHRWQTLGLLKLHYCSTLNTVGSLIIVTFLMLALVMIVIQASDTEKGACSFCDYKTTQRHLLHKHIKTHSEERPHKCHICGNAFKTVGALNNHVNTHSGNLFYFVTLICWMCSSNG